MEAGSEVLQYHHTATRLSIFFADQVLRVFEWLTRTRDAVDPRRACALRVPICVYYTYVRSVQDNVMR